MVIVKLTGALAAVSLTVVVPRCQQKVGKPSRKATNGFRCEWGAEIYVAFRSVVSTAKAGANPAGDSTN